MKNDIADQFQACHEIQTNATWPWTFYVLVGWSQLYISDSVNITYLV